MTNASATEKSAAKSARRRSLKDVGYPTLARAVLLPITAVANLATSTIVIGQFGQASFGYIMLVATLSQLIPFADLGMGAAVMNAFGDARKSRAQRLAVLGKSLRQVLLACLIAMALVVATSLCGLFGEVLGTDRYEDSVDVVMVWVALLFFLGVPLGLLQRILMAIGKNTLVVIIQSVAGPVTFLLVLLSVTLGIQPAWLPVMWPAGSLVALAIAAVAATRLADLDARTLFHCLMHRSPRVEVWNQAGPMIVIMVAMPVCLQSHRLILANVSGLNAVAQYSLIMTVVSPVIAILATAGQAIWSSRLRDTTALTRRAFGTLVVVMAGASLVAGVVILLPGRWVLEGLVGRGEVTVPVVLAIGAATFILAQALQTVPGAFMMGPESIRLQSVWVAATAAASVFLSVYLAAVMGAPGPFFATALCIIVLQGVPLSILSLNRIRRSLN